MISPTAVRRQIEAELTNPAALTPRPRIIRPTIPVGIPALDHLIGGGFLVGAVTELVGEECSGRTSVALAFLASITVAGKICAWVDASDTFNPASAASVGLDLQRLLWVRCGVQMHLDTQQTRRCTLPPACFAPRAITKGLHGGGHGTHPRSEAKGLSAAVDRFLSDETVAARCVEPLSKSRSVARTFEPSLTSSIVTTPTRRRARAYDAVEKALRSTDLLLQTGGFSAIVVDLGSIAPQHAAKVELSTWHRYRLAAEHTQASILLLSQYPCAKSSSDLQLRLHDLRDAHNEETVFTGVDLRAEILRQRFAPNPSNVIPMRKPPQSAAQACWQQRAGWAGPK